MALVVGGDVMRTLKGVNIIHRSMIGRLIDKQRVKEATMQPHHHGRVLVSSTQPQFSTLHKECLFLCLASPHPPLFSPFLPHFPPLRGPLVTPLPQSTAKSGIVGPFTLSFPQFSSKTKKQISLLPTSPHPFFLNWHFLR